MVVSSLFTVSFQYTRRSLCLDTFLRRVLGELVLDASVTHCQMPPCSSMCSRQQPSLANEEETTGGVQRNVSQCLQESCSLCESVQSMRNRHSKANGWKRKTITQWHRRGSEQSASMMQQCGVSTSPAGWCGLRDRMGFGTSDAHSLIFLDTLQFSFFLGVSFEYHNTNELRKAFPIIKFKHFTIFSCPATLL